MTVDCDRAKVPPDQRTQALKETDRFQFHRSTLIHKGVTTMCRCPGITRGRCFPIGLSTWRSGRRGFTMVNLCVHRMQQRVLNRVISRTCKRACRRLGLHKLHTAVWDYPKAAVILVRMILSVRSGDRTLRVRVMVR